MASTRRRRRIKGDRAFKRLIARLPDAVREEVVTMLEDAGKEIVAMQRADATVSSRARAAISMRVLRGALQLKTGIIGRPLNRRLWWTRVIEKGRKAVTVTARYRRVPGSTRKLGYPVRVRALAPRPFIYSARAEAVRRSMGGRLGQLWAKALARASQGATDE